MMSQPQKRIMEDLEKISLEELREVLSQAESMVEEKEKRFARLIDTLYRTLDELQNEFPQAYVPVQVSPSEMLDLMDYMIPKDYKEKVYIGG